MAKIVLVSTWVLFIIICVLLIMYQLHVAVCSTGCFNGGNCTSPDVCTCTSQWTGRDCRQGMK